MKQEEKHVKIIEIQKIKQQSSWDKLIEKILRPPRSTYKESSLGRHQFLLNQIKYERQEITINHSNKQIKLTLYRPQYFNRWIILFLHANSSSKLQCTSIIKYLPHQISLASFDFIGCGLSPYEEYISLGVRETQQVKTVVGFLEKQGWRVILWGRSMGAATALKYGKVPIIVADSSFSSFQRLCQEQIEHNSPKYIPKCLIWCLFPCLFCKLRSDIKQKGDYDIDNLNILKDINKISYQTMIIFISGDQDTLVDYKHSQRLCNYFNGKKKHIQIFKGSHNSKRPQQTLKKVMDLIRLELINRQKQYNQVKKQIEQIEQIDIQQIDMKQRKVNDDTGVQ